MAEKKDQNRTRLKKAAMIEAMKKTLGNVSQSCKTVDLARSRYYTWLKADLAFSKEINDVEDFVFDFVESKIMKQIQDGNTTMLIFFAKTKMKNRGYVERKEISVSEQPAFVIEESQTGMKKILEVIHKKNERETG